MVKYLNSSNYNKSMVNKNLGITFLFLILFTTIVSAQLDAYGTFKQGDEVRISQVCSDATYINISGISYPNGTLAVSNIAMVSSGSGEFYYNFNLTEPLGRYDVRGISDGCEKTFATYFEITPNGKVSNIQTAMIQILIILFFIGLIGTVYLIKRNIEFDKWEKNLFEKYAKRNLLKFVIGTIAYHLMKQSFLIYYLLGLPILVSLADMSFIYNLTDMAGLLSAVTMVYMVGIIVVGLIFFSYVQEWLMDLFDNMSNMEWGIE
jgi:hypothetical protein